VTAIGDIPRNPKRDRIASRGVRKEELASGCRGNPLNPWLERLAMLDLQKKEFTEVQISVFLYFCDSHCFP
jgi:hypothetical protein